MTLYEANAMFGGQVALAAKSERRRDLIGIVDWRVAECRRLGVSCGATTMSRPTRSPTSTSSSWRRRCAEHVGRRPGDSLAIDSWDLLAGAARPTGDVLVYDDHGGHQALDAVEALTRSARSVEYVTPERSVAPDVGASPAVGYFQMLADNDVRTTLLHRLVEIERRDRRLVVRSGRGREDGLGADGRHRRHRARHGPGSGVVRRVDGPLGEPRRNRPYRSAGVAAAVGQAQPGRDVRALSNR